MLENTAGSPATKKGVPISRRWALFLGIGGMAALLLSWRLFTFPTGFEGPSTPYALASLLACTLALLWAIPNPIPAEAAAGRRGWFALLAVGVSILLFVLPMLLRGRVLFGLPVLAAGVLIGLRQSITRRELFYALALASMACLAGLSSGWIKDFSPLAWAGLQVPLVVSGLLLGWKTFQSTGVAAYGVGTSRFISAGWVAALRAFGVGIVLSLPWALGNIILGGAHDTWVKSWWHPLIAIQPGIAEEAWGRLLMVALLFLVFRLAAQPRVALSTALVVAAYWFAYLHTPMGLEGIISTLLLGTFYALPISYLCLYRNLETAIGFHFCIDFARFLFAFLVAV